MGCPDSFPSFCYGIGTYVGIFSFPLCFSVGLAGFLFFGFFSAFTWDLLLSPSLLVLLTEFMSCFF